MRKKNCCIQSFPALETVEKVTIMLVMILFYEVVISIYTQKKQEWKKQHELAPSQKEREYC